MVYQVRLTVGKYGQRPLSLLNDSSDSNMYAVSIGKGKWAALHEDFGFYLFQSVLMLVLILIIKSQSLWIERF